MRRTERTGRFSALVLALVFSAIFSFGTASAAIGVRVGSEATVLSDDGLNIRQDPGAGSQILASADVDEYVYVLAGPQVVGTAEWFQIEYEGVTGWVVGDFLGAARERPTMSSRGTRGGVVAADRVWLPVPYLSQFDGSLYQNANCGPASVAMAVAAFDKFVNVGDLRRTANRIQGTTGWRDAGVSIDILADMVNANGLVARGLRANGGYDRWSMDEVRATLRNGNLLIPQVHLASLPGHAGSSRAVDHFIVITGFEGAFFRYNDSAFVGSGGHGLLMSEETFSTAWKRGDYPYAGFSVGPGAGSPLLIAPPVVVAPRFNPIIPRAVPAPSLSAPKLPVPPVPPVPQVPLPSAPILLPPAPMSPDTMASLARLHRDEQNIVLPNAQPTDARLTGALPNLGEDLGTNLVSALASQSPERETIQRSIAATTSPLEIGIGTFLAFALAFLGARRQWIWRMRPGRGSGWNGPPADIQIA